MIKKIFNSNDLKKKLKKIIQKNLTKKKNFSNSLELYKNGIVDSFDIINIFEEIEKEFSIKLKFNKDKNFKFTISYIANYIKTKTN